MTQSLDQLLSQQEATRTPVETHANMWKVLVVGMGDPVKLRDKNAPDGRPSYSSGCLLKMEGKDGVVKTDKSASVHVVEPVAGGSYEEGVRYVADGTVWVQPWESNGRIALSITVERLVPVAKTPPAPVSRSSVEK